MLEYLTLSTDYILHLDSHLTALVTEYGPLTYLILFSVIFADTGLVVTPFFPSDSLLFTAGALASLDAMNLPFLIVFMTFSAVLGDTVNYWIGRLYGQKIVDNPKVPFINQEHIDKTQQFYKKHGGKTIALARFVPIIRTFAPFVAGVGNMNYAFFLKYNAIGGAIWVNLFLFSGYFLGTLPFFRENFYYLALAMVGLLIFPLIYDFILHRKTPDVPGMVQEELESLFKNK